MDPQSDINVAILYEVVKNGDVDGLVDLLLRSPSAANARHRLTGKCLIHVAAEYGHLAAVVTLLSFGADPNMREGTLRLEADETERSPGYSALDYAARRNSLIIVRLLLAHGAKPHAADHNGGTPLHAAAVIADPSVAEALFVSGASLETVCYERTFDEKYGWQWVGRPIEVAAKSGNAKMIRWLIEHGASIGAFWMDQRTPLHLAAAYGQLDSVVALVEGGADINALSDEREYPGKFGFTPLHYAARNGSVKVARVLIEFGADPSIHSIAIYDSPHAPKGYGEDLPEKLARESGHRTLAQFLRSQRLRK